MIGYLAPYNASMTIPGKTYSKIMENIQKELRSAFELSHLLEDYSLTLSQPSDLHFIAKIHAFNFFRCTIHYGPDLALSVRRIPFRERSFNEFGTLGYLVV